MFFTHLLRLDRSTETHELSPDNFARSAIEAKYSSIDKRRNHFALQAFIRTAGDRTHHKSLFNSRRRELVINDNLNFSRLDQLGFKFAGFDHQLTQLCTSPQVTILPRQILECLERLFRLATFTEFIDQNQCSIVVFFFLDKAFDRANIVFQSIDIFLVRWNFSRSRIHENHIVDKILFVLTRLSQVLFHRIELSILEHRGRQFSQRFGQHHTKVIANLAQILVFIFNVQWQLSSASIQSLLPQLGIVWVPQQTLHATRLGFLDVLVPRIRRDEIIIRFDRSLVRTVLEVVAGIVEHRLRLLARNSEVQKHADHQQKAKCRESDIRPPTVPLVAFIELSGKRGLDLFFGTRAGSREFIHRVETTIGNGIHFNFSDRSRDRNGIDVSLFAIRALWLNLLHWSRFLIIIDDHQFVCIATRHCRRLAFHDLTSLLLSKLTFAHQITENSTGFHGAFRVFYLNANFSQRLGFN